MATVTFTNSLGSIQFERCLLSIMDQWRWTGGAVTRTKNINVVQGWVSRADPSFEAILTDKTASRGDRGTLTLPWATLTNIQLDDFAMGDGKWDVMTPASASFLDDNPDNNIYTFHFFGVELHNPKFSFTPPSRNIKDDYPQMPLATTGSIDETNLKFGAMRTHQNEELISLTLQGAMAVQNAALPVGLDAVLAQQVGTIGSANYTAAPARITNYASLPDGYPSVFKLGAAIPELQNGMSLTTVFVHSASINWQVEQGMAEIAINMLCQPQVLMGGT